MYVNPTQDIHLTRNQCVGFNPTLQMSNPFHPTSKLPGIPVVYSVPRALNRSHSQDDYLQALPHKIYDLGLALYVALYGVQYCFQMCAVTQLKMHKNCTTSHIQFPAVSLRPLTLLLPVC